MVTAIINGLTFHCTPEEKISGKASKRDWGEGAVYSWLHSNMGTNLSKNDYKMKHLLSKSSHNSLAQIQWAIWNNLYSHLKELNKWTTQMNLRMDFYNSDYYLKLIEQKSEFRAHLHLVSPKYVFFFVSRFSLASWKIIEFWLGSWPFRALLSSFLSYWQCNPKPLAQILPIVGDHYFLSLIFFPSAPALSPSFSSSMLFPLFSLFFWLEYNFHTIKCTDIRYTFN